MKLSKDILYVVFTIYYAFVFFLISLFPTLPLFLVYFILRIFKNEKILEAYSGFTASLVGRIHLIVGFERFKIQGKENIPVNTRNICIISNHQSLSDIPLVLLALPFTACFIAKKEAWKMPILHTWMNILQCIPIVRNSPKSSAEAIGIATERLKQGKPVIVFPEGTRSRSNGMRRLKKGSFRMAYRADSIILPVTIDGAYKLFEEKKLINLFQKVIVTVHPSVDCSKLSEEDKHDLPEKLWHVLNSGLRNPNSEVMPDKKKMNKSESGDLVDQTAK